MRHILVSTCAAALLGPATLSAEPTFMLGGGVAFGGGQSPQFAITAKILSDNQPEEAVFGLGGSYYLGSGEFGADLSAGYLFDNTALMVGYDFLQNAPVFSYGYAEADEAEAPTTTPDVTVTTAAPTTAAPTTTSVPTTSPA
ncbi:hypothetical protein SAMN04488005_0725 [Yoonia tamlensis]|uniref:Outer membrane protein beta-barrel domain-containing protein n=1 Tax=Yoonia tamlensis TaxID=390270 RepID=A0A1I6FY72_9RHOB|nr:hypothetical protein [Yoonia tamlensis]SFR34888.1 hypothetical protein SAMN04488005_0725 [Yoonia tamlensis]